MISSPNAFFTAAEANQENAEFRLLPSFFPHYFKTGLEIGGGTFTDCSYVSPGRVTVDPTAVTASWTGPDKQGTAAYYPIAAVITWTQALVGYAALVQLKTASSQAELALASWITLTSGNSYNLYEWYAFRVVWTGYRCLATVIADPSNPRQAYAVVSLPDDLQSYALAGPGGDTYLEDLLITGEFTIDLEDVMMEGALSLERPRDFADLVASEFTLKLINESGKYDPDNAAFIFAGEDYWWDKKLRLRAGYVRPGTAIIDSLLLYEGKVQDPGGENIEIDDDGRQGLNFAEILTRDYLSEMFKQKIGAPDSDNLPQPLIFGTIYKEAPALADSNPFPVSKEADFETGDLSQLTAYQQSANGTLEISTANVFRGTYCLRTKINNAANEGTWAKLELDEPSNMFFAQASMFVAAMPATPANCNTYLLSLYSTNGSPAIRLYVDPDGKIVVWDGPGGFTVTDTVLSSYQGQQTIVTVAALWSGTSAHIRMWFNSDELMKKDISFLQKLKGISWGVTTGAVAETWDIKWDELKIWDIWYPASYQVYGGPFLSVDAMYTDGVLTTRKVTAIGRRENYLTGGRIGIATDFTAAAVTETSNFTAYPQYGLVVWNDYANPPSGTIILKLTKDAVTHPVDALEAVAAAIGQAAAVDAAYFAVAKAAIPNDSIGCYFENISAADAVREICGRNLIDCWLEQGKIRVKAWTATALSGSVSTLTSAGRKSIRTSNPLDDLVPKVSGIWGWAARNPNLRYEKKDQDLVDRLGDNEQSLDFSWGQPVMSDNEVMVRAKVDALFRRLSAPRQPVEWRQAELSLMRTELGDVVTYNSVLREVMSKEIKFAPPRDVTLTMERFRGVV